MATAFTPSGSTYNKDSANSISKSFFQKTVCLNEWWLVRPGKECEEKGLAVAGITYRWSQAVRVFSSGSILRRHDVFTLETVDGIFIIIKGFLDKAKTEANGFPSEVCLHFVFGFPPYWENYALNHFGGEPLTVDASPCITDSGGLFPKPGKVLSPEAPEATEREPFPRDSLVKNMASFDVSEDSPSDCVKQTLGPSGLEENHVPLSEHDNVKDHKKDEYNSRPCILRNRSECKGKIFVSPCHAKEINDSNLLSKAIEEPRKVKSRKISSGEMELSKEMGTDDIADCFEGIISTHSLSKLQRKWKDNPCGHGLQSNPEAIFLTTKDCGSGENARCNIVKDSGARSNTSLLVNGLQDLGDQMIITSPDSRSTEDDAGRKHRISRADEGVKGNTRNKHTNFHGMKTRRTYETRSSCKKKDESSIASPESLFLNRSRSGRLLLPTLEFWHNQRAIYNEDGQFTGIKDMHVNASSKVGPNLRERKRRIL